MAAPSSDPAKDAAKSGANGSADVEPWQVAHPKNVNRGTWQRVLSLPKLPLNLIGGGCWFSGWAVGQLEVSLKKKMNPNATLADSLAFTLGFSAWLFFNGIAPQIKFDVGPDGKAADIRSTPFIVSNHLSDVDPLVLFAYLGFPRFVAKVDILKVPVIGKLAIDIGTLLVERESKESREATVAGIKQHAADWKQGMQPLAIFPEGTRSNEQDLIPFKRGAFVAGAPVRPVLLVYTGRWSPEHPKYMEDGSGKVVKYSDGKWGLQFMSHYRHSVAVTVMPPYTPSEEEKRDPDLYAANVHRVMQQRYKELRAAGPRGHSHGWRYGLVVLAVAVLMVVLRK